MIIKTTETIKDYLAKNTIKAIKDKMSISISFRNHQKIRLFLLRCDRKKFFKNVSRYDTRSWLPMKDDGIEKSVQMLSKYYPNKKLIRDYIIAKQYGMLNSYFIKLDHRTFLVIEKVENDNNICVEMRLTFYGKNIKKYIYFLYRTFRDFDKLQAKFPLKYKVLYSYDHSKLDNITNMKSMRTFNDYIIDKETHDKVMHYIHNALSVSEKFDKKFNITYSPGLMFYGKPGTGKSVIIDAIASEINAIVIYMDLMHIESSINEINSMMSPDKRHDPIILVYEDIDFMFKDRDTFDNLEYKNNYNTLLQLLDGYLSMPNTINIATTNHIENLDEALIRDGRFDLRIELKGLNKPEAIRMCEMYDIAPDDILHDKEFPINPAFLQKEIIVKSKEVIKNEL